MKTCRVCNETKPLEEFHKRSAAKDGRQTLCKLCNNLKTKEWQKNNPEKVEANWRRNKRTPEQLLERRARKYGLTGLQLQGMLDACGGRCQVCGDDSTVLVVDHSHETGEVRGLLCSKCNTGIGLLGDCIESLQKAIKYLG